MNITGDIYHLVHHVRSCRTANLASFFVASGTPTWGLVGAWTSVMAPFLYKMSHFGLLIIYQTLSNLKYSGKYKYF